MPLFRGVHQVPLIIIGNLKANYRDSSGIDLFRIEVAMEVRYLSFLYASSCYLPPITELRDDLSKSVLLAPDI